MYKLLFIMLIAGVGGIYLLKQKGADVPSKLNSAYKAPATPTPTATPVVKNAYLAGECFTDSAENFAYARILSFDGNTNMYTYILCSKFKGCAKEQINENFNIFEKQFAADKKIGCPAEVR